MKILVLLLGVNINYFLFQPLEQFEVKIINCCLTNFVSVVFLFFLLMFFLSLYIGYSVELPWNMGFVNGIKQYISFINLLLYDLMQNLHVYVYFPVILTMSSFVLISNIYGLFPYGFTLTSHIFVTFVCSMSIFIGVTIIGFLNNNSNFVRFFIPSGVGNLGLTIFLTIIEIVSYMIRPLSLSIRLFANMLAGHTLLFILIGSVLSVQSYKIFFLFFFPLLIVVGIVFLEVAIAFIQAYVFSVLLILYLLDMYCVMKH